MSGLIEQAKAELCRADGVDNEVYNLRMLNDHQQRDVWERWLSSEMRANYFGDLAERLSSLQARLTWMTLLFSSGALAAILGDAHIPASLWFVKSALALLATGVSFASLVMQNTKRSIDCSDLQFRWNRLAAEYESLWNNVYADSASETLSSLTEKSAELSRSSGRAGVKYQRRLMEKWEDHVLRNRAPQAEVAAIA